MSCEPSVMKAENLGESSSADAWTDYGVLVLNMIEVYQCCADAWTKYGVQIIKFYDCALGAFEQALEIDPNHASAAEHRDAVQRKWANWMERLEQIKPCKVCEYYYGRDGLNCAVHPIGPSEALCRDWELSIS